MGAKEKAFGGCCSNLAQMLVAVAGMLAVKVVESSHVLNQDLLIGWIWVVRDRNKGDSKILFE